jgi:SAM-dependent methyltransferase
MFGLYRDDIIKTLTKYNIDNLAIQSNDGSIYELEAKFTSYDYEERKFSSGVPHVHYIRLIEILDKDINYTKKIEKSDVILYEDNIRKITIDKVGGQEIILERKTNIKNIDIKDYNIRISLNNEILADIKNIELKGITRGRIRHSYTSLISPIRIDITEITQITEKKITIKYEVEIEYHGLKSNIQIFFDKIEEIFKLMKGTKNIYSNQMKKDLDNDISLLLKTKPETGTEAKSMVKSDEKYSKITSKTLVRARNIKYRDLVYGGIIGNKTVLNKNVLIDKSKGVNYYITYKADGIHKYLIIHDTGVWLVYPDDEYNLVISSNDENFKHIEKYKDSVFDTELVIPKYNENNTEYYILIFDCLCFEGRTKENKSYTDRLKYCKSISDVLNNSVITVKLKEARLLPEDPKSFFRLIKDFYAKRKNLNWGDDGFIFTPNNVIYNPKSQTIKFMVKRDKGSYSLYVLSNNKEVKFNGSDNNPLDYKNVEFSLDFNNLVIKYSWNGKKLVPIKKANPTDTPDSKSSAIIIWDDVTSPDVSPSKLLTNTPDVCKWKHPEDLTIDFLIEIKAEKYNTRRLDLYVFDGETSVIFTGTERFPLSSDNIRMEGTKLNITESLNNKIIEFEWKKENNKIILQPRKYRSDKNNPNQKIVAEDVWEDIMDPIFIEDLVGDTPELAIKYHNTIKGDLYFEMGKKYNKNFTLLDIGSGRGGDIGRWKKFTGNIIAVEPYKPNRDELIKRLNKSGINDRVTIVPLGGEKTVEITKAVKENIPGGKVDVISLMLSMSFFWSSKKHLEALVRTIVTNLKPGGTIIFLTIDGDSLEQIFEPINGKKVNEMKISGAKIHLYPELGPEWGRPVDFELPGSIIEEGGQREYIVHIQDFTERLSKFGFVLEKISKAIKPNLLLSEQNLLYTSLYSYGVYSNKNGSKLKEFNTNIELPEIPKVKIIQLDKALEPLEVIVRLKGIALNDDSYAPVECTWFKGNVVRIATIGGENCFIHAILKSFYEKYQNDDDSHNRIKIANDVRYGLGTVLSYENPEYPDYTYWQTIGNGIYPKMIMLKMINPELKEDYSLQGLINLFNSKEYLNNEVYKFIAEIFKINVYIVKITKNDIELVIDRIYKPERPNIVISGDRTHFEVIAIDVDGLFQTIFDDDDEFILSLDLKYPENKSENEIFNPDETFINDFIDTFTINEVFIFPEEIYDIYPDPDDPFRKSLDRLYENIINITNYNEFL